MFSGGIERDQWHEMWEFKTTKIDIFSLLLSLLDKMHIMSKGATDLQPVSNYVISRIHLTKISR